MRFTPNGVQELSANQWAAALTNHDPNPPLSVELAVIDEDSDAWWSNSQHGFSQVPIAVAALALAASVAIAGSFIHQDERPFPNSLGGMEEDQRVVAVGADPLPQVFLADEEILPRPALADDEGWTGWRQPYAAVAPAITADEDVLPQQPRALDGDDGWLWQQPYKVPAALAITADDDVIVQQAAVIAFDEDVWTAWQQTYLAAAVLPAFFATDEVVPAAAFVPDEDYWLDLRAERTELVVTNFDLLSSGGPTTPTAAPLQVDEVYWIATWPALVQPVVPYFWFNDELAQPAAPSDDPGGGGETPGRKLETPSIWQWDVADDLPTPASALAITEPEWQVYSPPLVAARPLWQFQADDEIATAAAALQIVEPEWQVYSPPWPSAQPLYLPDPEQALPASLSIVEPEWQVYSPPWPRAQPLYLPDPEQAVPLSLLVDEMYWDVRTPAPLAAIVRLWYSEDEYGPWITPPVYGWGARGRIGREIAVDVLKRVSTEIARDPNGGIGTDSATDLNNGIGSDDA